MPGKTGKEKTINAFICFSIVPVLFCLDRLFKYLADRSLSLGQSVPIIPNIFHLTLVHNTGAAFGLWKDARLFLLYFSVFAAGILVFYCVRVFGHRPVDLFKASGWALVTAGALGNLYDRFRYGYVIDYLDFRVWPVFNLADTAICVGAAWAILYTVRCQKESKGS